MKSATQVRRQLEENGISISALARAHGIDRSVFVDLLRGRTKGKWGSAHKAAVVLGMKKAPQAPLKPDG